MATPTRIYKVQPTAGGQARLVRAAHPSHALRHVAEASFSVAVATHDDLEQMLSAGVPVERINAEQREENERAPSVAES